MERAYQKCYSQNGVMVIRRWHDRSHVRLASTREYTQSRCGMGVKMRIYLTLVTIVCFSFGAVTGCSVHALVQNHAPNNMMQAKYVSMSLRELSEVRI